MGKKSGNKQNTRRFRSRGPNIHVITFARSYRLLTIMNNVINQILLPLQTREPQQAHGQRNAEFLRGLCAKKITTFRVIDLIFTIFRSCVFEYFTKIISAKARRFIDKQQIKDVKINLKLAHATLVLS